MSSSLIWAFWLDDIQECMDSLWNTCSQSLASLCRCQQVELELKADIGSKMDPASDSAKGTACNHEHG